MGSMKRTEEHTHEMRNTWRRKCRRKLMRFLPDLKGGAICVESGMSWCYCEPGCLGAVVSAFQVVNPGFLSNCLPVPTHTHPHRHTEWRNSDSRSRCVYPCFCKTWDIARPGLGNTLWMGMHGPWCGFSVQATRNKWRCICGAAFA